MTELLVSIEVHYTNGDADTYHYFKNMEEAYTWLQIILGNSNVMSLNDIKEKLDHAVKQNGYRSAHVFIAKEEIQLCIFYGHLLVGKYMAL